MSSGSRVSQMDPSDKSSPVLIMCDDDRVYTDPSLWVLHPKAKTAGDAVHRYNPERGQVEYWDNAASAWVFDEYCASVGDAVNYGDPFVAYRDTWAEPVEAVDGEC